MKPLIAPRHLDSPTSIEKLKMRVREVASSISKDAQKKVVKSNEFRLCMLLRQNGVILTPFNQGKPFLKIFKMSHQCPESIEK